LEQHDFSDPLNLAEL